MEKQVESIIKLLSYKGITKWNEDAVWRYMREMFPYLPDGVLQQLADRVQWVLTR